MAARGNSGGLFRSEVCLSVSAGRPNLPALAMTATMPLLEPSPVFNLRECVREGFRVPVPVNPGRR